MNDTLTASELAKRLGIPLRTVRYLTDLDIMHCLPETRNEGHGNKRRYAAEYLPEAALIAELASYKIHAQALLRWAPLIHGLIEHGERAELPGAVSKEWFGQAIAGEIETYIVVTPGTESGSGIAWVKREQMIAKASWGPSVIVIAVSNVVKRFTV
ncbi:MAG: hypothetical protein O3B08_02165 [Proteobacteria bacterium]|nr:hypothetical protein [Pseudomonadota bacterium]